LVEGKGRSALSAEECIRQSYNSQIFDEMIKPTVIQDEEGEPIAKISDNDSVVFINFRQDRALQLTQVFLQPEALPEKYRKPTLQNLYFATMTEYKKGLTGNVVFPPTDLKNSLAEVLSKNNFTQLHIAESEKYAHVTAFLNCGAAEKFPGEERIIVTSPKENKNNYVDHPEMSAEELTDKLVDKISTTEINFFVANFANPDMVGHTGNLPAAIAAIETIDKNLKRIMDASLLADAILMITADHGNAEQMINTKTGDIDKDHTTNPVPFLLVGNEFKLPLVQEKGYASLASQVPVGVIGDIAPTILELLGIDKPKEMTGISLFKAIKR